LNALKPEMYRERASVEHTGKNGGTTRPIYPRSRSRAERHREIPDYGRRAVILHKPESPRPLPEPHPAAKGRSSNRNMTGEEDRK
jgi:hypothetical protein